MATTDNSVIVELYDLSITERKDDRFGRVVTTKSVKIDDLINKAVARRTDINASTFKAVYDILTGIAVEEVGNGASVEYGLGFFSLVVNGVFIGDNAKWDPAVHTLAIRAIPTATLRTTAKAASVDVRGMAETGTVINSVTDVVSSEVNSRLTPGGGVNLTGSKIKLDGDNTAVGIRLINQANNEAIRIPKTSILINDPSKVTFIVPATLTTGDYKLSLTTQFSSTKTLLKDPRTYEFDYVLSVL